MILEILDIQPASQITRYKIRINTSLKHRVSCETVPFEFLSWKRIYCALAICSLYEIESIIKFMKKTGESYMQTKNELCIVNWQLHRNRTRMMRCLPRWAWGVKTNELNSGDYTSSKRSKQRPGGVVLSLFLYICLPFKIEAWIQHNAIREGTPRDSRGRTVEETSLI